MGNEEPLVSISEASRLLGVSEPALRQWTDEGKIKAFVTPGGHRRYSRAELRKLMTGHPKLLGLKDLATKLEDTAEIHRNIDRNFLSDSPWFSRLSEASQRHLALLGRRFLGLIVSYVAEPGKRKDTIGLARQNAEELGRTLAELELPLTDAVHIFLLHREPLMNMATGLLKKREASNERIAGVIPLADRLMDEALVALVAAHQLSSRNDRQESGGGVEL